MFPDDPSSFCCDCTIDECKKQPFVCNRCGRPSTVTTLLVGTKAEKVAVHWCQACKTERLKVAEVYMRLERERRGLD